MWVLKYTESISHELQLYFAMCSGISALQHETTELQTHNCRKCCNGSSEVVDESVVCKTVSCLRKPATIPRETTALQVLPQSNTKQPVLSFKKSEQTFVSASKHVEKSLEPENPTELQVLESNVVHGLRPELLGLTTCQLGCPLLHDKF